MSAESFMQEFYEGTDPNPIFSHERVWQWRAAFEVRIFDNHIRLAFIRSFARGKGEGSAALDWFCKLADKHHIAISGAICPMGSKPRLSTRVLKKWYRSRGFEISGDRMIRYPEKTALTS